MKKIVRGMQCTRTVRDCLRIEIQLKDEIALKDEMKFTGSNTINDIFELPILSIILSIVPLQKSKYEHQITHYITS